MARPSYDKQVGQEQTLASFIPYSSHISPTTLLTRDGDLLRIWKIAGIGFETANDDTLLIRKEEFNTLLRSIATNHVALWTHMIRRRATDRLQGQFDNDFCRELDRKYYDSFVGYRMMANELYLTLLYRPAPSAGGKILTALSRRSLDEILNDQKAALRKLDEIAFQLEASLRSYGIDGRSGIEVLSTYRDAHGGLCSQPLELLNFLVSGEWQNVRVPQGPIHAYLGTSWLFAGTETIEIRTPTQTRFAQGIDFKDYGSHTEPGILNDLLYENFEFVMTQSFSFMAKREGKDFLERQKRQLINTKDGGSTQIVDITQAIDELIDGKFAMGEYHFSLFVFGETVEAVRRHTTSAMASIQPKGFLAALINTATEAAYFAQLPGNWAYRPRIARLTSRNFASLSGFHNFRAGKRNGNPWGEAVTMFKTPSGQPLYFNCHYARLDDDAYDKKALGNVRVIGQSGAGKTVFLNMLLCQLQKYKATSSMGFTTVFFDKDRGAELLIRAIGGKYLAIKNGQPTGLNPFQMAASEENILFLERLVKQLISAGGEAVSTSDDAKISKAVRTVMRMDMNRRRLSFVLQNLTEGLESEARENSVAKRLERWCVDNGNGKRGSLWWVFDNPVDQIDLTTHTNYGFDGTHFLDNKEVRTPISMYLLHRMESIIDGRRFVYFMDEAWKWVNDEAFAEFAGNKQLTIRKQNGLGIFATQMPSSLLASSIAAQLVQQVATEVYLPNPKADAREYIEGFKCTPAEFDLIRSMGEESRRFLVKQGGQSMIGLFDLSDVKDAQGNTLINFSNELEILSGSTDNVELLDDILQEVGEAPTVWLPVFFERLKARRLTKRKGA